jgi:Sap, sulfolipid-1-addressing protein
VVGLTAVVAGLTAVAGAVQLNPGSDRSRGASALLIALGVVLIVVAVRKLHRRPGQDETPSLPGWMDGIAGFGATRSLAVGGGVGAGNPKNIAVALGTAVAVSSAGIPGAQQALVLAIYVVLASLGVAAPIGVVLLLGDRSEAVLDAWKAWLTRHSAAMMAVIYLLLGTVLIGKGVGAV